MKYVESIVSLQTKSYKLSVALKVLEVRRFLWGVHLQTATAMELNSICVDMKSNAFFESINYYWPKT